jgi:hypothetical protein
MGSRSSRPDDNVAAVTRHGRSGLRVRRARITYDRLQLEAPRYPRYTCGNDHRLRVLEPRRIDQVVRVDP